MKLPAFLFEEQDINYLKDKKLLQTERYTKKTKTPELYFYVDVSELEAILDYVYLNENISDSTGSRAFAIKIATAIFSLIDEISTASDKLALIAAINSLYLISPKDAQKLAFLTRAI